MVPTAAPDSAGYLGKGVNNRVYQIISHSISQVLQVYTNLVAGHTGQLSLITQMMNTGGNMVRTFTTAVIYMQDKEGDCLGLAVMVLSLACNCVILIQVSMCHSKKVRDKEN